MAKDLNVSLGLLTQEFKRGLKSASRDLRRFASQTQSIGTKLTTGLSVPLGGLGLAAIKAAADFEKLESILKATTDDASTIQDQLQSLRKISEAPGLGFEQAVKGSARLQALGYEATQAEKIISEFGNAVARSGGGAAEFDGVSLALGQIISKGKITAEEINQLNERIFEIRPALIDAFGTADTEALQKLGISSEEFVEKITEQFAKLDRVGPTLLNSFENAGIAIRLFLNDIGKEVLKVIPVREALNSLGDFLQRLSDRFTTLSGPTKKTIIQIAALAAAIGPVILGVSALAAGFATFLNPIGLTVAGIAALAAGFIALYNNNESFRNAVQKLGAYLKIAFLGLVIAVKDTFNEIAPSIQRIINFANALRLSFKKLAKDALIELGPLQSFFPSLGDLAIGSLKSLNGFRVALITIFKDTVEAVAKLIRPFKDIFEKGLNKDTIKSALQSIGKGLTTFNPVTGALGAGKALGESFLTGFKEGYESEGLQNFLDNTKTTFKEAEKIAQESGGKIAASISPTASGGFAPGTTNQGNNFTGLADLSGPDILRGSKSDIELLEFLATLQNRTEAYTKAVEGLNVVQTISGENTTESIKKYKQLEDSLKVGQVLVNKFGGAFDALFDNIGKGAKTAFQAFRDAIKQVLAELVKAIVKAAVFAGIAAIFTGGASFGASFGSIFKDLAGFKLFADGGLVTQPTRGIVGEAGPEAVIPLDRLFNGGGGKQELELRVEGTELVALLKNSESTYNRLF